MCFIYFDIVYLNKKEYALNQIYDFLNNTENIIQTLSVKKGFL